MELAKMEYVSHPTMSRIMATLVREGLVHRTSDDEDRRSAKLGLTDEGRAAYERVYARRLQLIETLLGRLKPETVDDLLQTLEKLPQMHRPNSTEV